jgi:hypothetical protein
VLAAPASAQSITPVTPANPIRVGQDLMVNGGFERNAGAPQLDSREATSTDRTTWRDGDYLKLNLRTPYLDYTEYWYARNPNQQRGTWLYDYIWDLRQDAGQPLDITFEAFANGTNASWFYIDDVALTTGVVLFPMMTLC